MDHHWLKTKKNSRTAQASADSKTLWFLSFHPLRQRKSMQPRSWVFLQHWTRKRRIINVLFFWFPSQKCMYPKEVTHQRGCRTDLLQCKHRFLWSLPRDSNAAFSLPSIKSFSTRQKLVPGTFLVPAPSRVQVCRVTKSWRANWCWQNKTLMLI